MTVRENYRHRSKRGFEADVFMSAATKQMNALTEQGLVEKDSVVDLLQNQIVLITAADLRWICRTLRILPKQM